MAMLIPDIETLKENVAVQARMDFDSIKPHVTAMERKHLAPLLGATTYATLAAYTGSPADADLDTLLTYVRPALANLAVWRYVAKEGAVAIGDNGVKIENADPESPVRKWQIDQLRQELHADGMEALDQMLAFLEGNTATYADWKNEKRTDYQDCLLYSTALFQQYQPINDSRLTFMAIKPFILQAEQEAVVNVISQDFYDELLNQLQGGTLTTANNTILPKVRALAAYKGLLWAWPSLSLKVTANGLVIDAREVNMDQNETRKAASDVKVDALIRQLEQKANAAESALKKYLEANADSYATYKASDKYLGETTTGINNNDKKMIYL